MHTHPIVRNQPSSNMTSAEEDLHWNWRFNASTFSELLGETFDKDRQGLKEEPTKQLSDTSLDLPYFCEEGGSGGAREGINSRQAFESPPHPQHTYDWCEVDDVDWVPEVREFLQLVRLFSLPRWSAILFNRTSRIIVSSAQSLFFRHFLIFEKLPHFQIPLFSLFFRHF